MSEPVFVQTGERSTPAIRSGSEVAANGEVNPEEVRFLYESHARSVYGYLRGMVGRDDAEDLTQQVFLKLIIRFRHYRTRSDVPFSAWLRRVAHNLAIDHIRASRPGTADPEDLAYTSADEFATERARSLVEALAELPPSQRQVVVLRYMGGLSPGEIASLLGRTEDSIHCLHHRGRGTLKRELTRRGAAPLTLQRAA
jgi:RNA polymerase sigma-70 factor, ECF subfamily